jgi:hypothetical protein
MKELNQQGAYEQYIVQSLIGNYSWSSVTRHGQYFHVGTVGAFHLLSLYCECLLTHIHIAPVPDADPGQEQEHLLRRHSLDGAVQLHPQVVPSSRYLFSQSPQAFAPGTVAALCPCGGPRRT